MATRRTRRGLGCLLLALLLVGLAGLAGFAALRSRGLTEPVPGQQRCVATAGGRSVVLDLEQAHLTSIVVGLSVRRGLPPRAASIAMATVYQESGIRNLDSGDRDSVGLFQQRPSQGWGTAQQLQDPYYATGKFYDALVRVRGWQDDDINDVAQKVQRSGHPEAYRDHEADGRVLASVFTGHSPGGLSCLTRSARPGNPDAFLSSVRRSLGTVEAKRSGRVLTLRAGDARLGWAYATSAVADAGRYGITDVATADHSWHTSGTSLPSWRPAAELPAGSVRVTFRG